jgi:hypothetical protein
VNRDKSAARQMKKLVQQWRRWSSGEGLPRWARPLRDSGVPGSEHLLGFVLLPRPLRRGETTADVLARARQIAVVIIGTHPQETTPILGGHAVARRLLSGGVPPDYPVVFWYANSVTGASRRRVPGSEFNFNRSYPEGALPAARTVRGRQEAAILAAERSFFARFGRKLVVLDIHGASMPSELAAMGVFSADENPVPVSFELAGRRIWSGRYDDFVRGLAVKIWPHRFFNGARQATSASQRIEYLARRGVPSLVLEGGQQDDPLSALRTVEATYRFLHTLGAIGQDIIARSKVRFTRPETRLRFDIDLDVATTVELAHRMSFQFFPGIVPGKLLAAGEAYATYRDEQDVLQLVRATVAQGVLMPHGPYQLPREQKEVLGFSPSALQGDSHYPTATSFHQRAEVLRRCGFPVEDPLSTGLR